MALKIKPLEDRVIVEAMAAMVILDYYLINKTKTI